MYRDVRAANGNLLVLDTHTYELHNFAFGRIFPISDPEPYPVDDHYVPQGQVWSFGVDDQQRWGNLTPEIEADPWSWCAARIDETRVRLDAMGLGGRVGEAGAAFLLRNGDNTFRSAFESPEDLIKSHATRQGI
jgi:hypothetical protein